LQAQQLQAQQLQAQQLQAQQLQAQQLQAQIEELERNITAIQAQQDEDADPEATTAETNLDAAIQQQQQGDATADTQAVGAGNPLNPGSDQAGGAHVASDQPDTDADESEDEDDAADAQAATAAELETRLTTLRATLATQEQVAEATRAELATKTRELEPLQAELATQASAVASTQQAATDAVTAHTEAQHQHQESMEKIVRLQTEKTGFVADHAQANANLEALDLDAKKDALDDAEQAYEETVAQQTTPRSGP
jgi:hypothetical protein